jgi:ATP-dependent RNA helicase DeaD
VFSKLENTRISGKLIELREDQGAPSRRDDRDERPVRKPRH